MTPVILLSAAIHFAQPWAEAPADRDLRLARVATVAAGLPLPADTMAAAIDESGLDPDVHAGTKLGGFGRARCVGQIGDGNTLIEDKDDLVGLDLAATRRCVEAISVTLVASRDFCLARHYRTNWRPAMVSVYAGNGSCWLWKGAFRRARLAEKIAAWRGPVTDEMLGALAQVELERIETKDSPTVDGGSVRGAVRGAARSARAVPSSGIKPAVQPLGRSTNTPVGPAGVIKTPPVGPSGFDCSTVVVLRPPGWVVAPAVTRRMAQFARAVLSAPMGTTVEATIDGRRVLARVDQHCDPVRGPHPGVSLYVPEGP